MGTEALIMLVGGAVAAALGFADVLRSDLRGLTSWGVVVLGVALVLLALR
jgi:hypothetical protein